MTRTHPFRRTELIAALHRLSPTGEYERDAVAATIAVLEAYPLLQVSRAATAAVLKDLSERAGFRELIEQASDWMAVTHAIEQRVAETVKYTDPLPESASITDDFDFSP